MVRDRPGSTAAETPASWNVKGASPPLLAVTSTPPLAQSSTAATDGRGPFAGSAAVVLATALTAASTTAQRAAPHFVACLTKGPSG
ncbi:hypothetical protein GCM10010289_09070 [Streptomyces violascens]|uniref:Uncharacterized protein n=1 Tax=Streptomyces violascens TaxID=67381 RepID=A0ABQ3QH43_9ACTN|nr:hypothetical protein GCM10010289_09070 [Streptomyces violascens]GHI36572.1 hypothetical protein Sviol_09800 [Streptomyces violascens]